MIQHLSLWQENAKGVTKNEKRAADNKNNVGLVMIYLKMFKDV